MKYIEANFKFEEVGDGLLKLLFDLGNSRAQLVFASVNETTIQYFSPCALISDVSAKDALEANSEYSLGMQILGDSYMVKHLALIEDLDASEVNQGFNLVCSIADELENKLVGGDRF
jgi:hypothetical protein